ncbi:polysaccharide biosynthesis/export family protein [Mesorhizobium sophorae]|uniref:polysaccharide biosynthesis/export family protein n=1 Tax=Mesorhizobium sophorae TaxID=1300294 RepID=UPI000BA2C588|nr:polysaccharide biosynthesis/export family protein [Mesorhizobium sophorae]
MKNASSGSHRHAISQPNWLGNLSAAACRAAAHGKWSGGRFRTSALLLCVGLVPLAGCQVVPGAGPDAGTILAASGKSGSEQHRPNAVVFDVVEIDGHSARLVADYSSQIFSKRFGMGGPLNTAVFGVGDRVRVIIFEASDTGLFATKDSKQTSLDLEVQPDGNVPIPYAGLIRFAGRTAEQTRKSILAALTGKAVEPDVIVTSIGTDSRVATVTGAVKASAQVPLNLNGNRLMDVIAKAGGPVDPPYESYVTLSRGTKTATTLLKTIIESPVNNVFIQPNDQIFLAHDPRTFTMLGQTTSNNRIAFGANDLNLLEAIALAGGGNDRNVSASGYFVFRYEEEGIVRALLGDRRFDELLSKGLASNKDNKYPIVYRLDMNRPDSLVSGQTFPIKNRDVIYASRHPAVELQYFLSLAAQPLNIARGVSGF